MSAQEIKDEITSLKNENIQLKNEVAFLEDERDDLKNQLQIAKGNMSDLEFDLMKVRHDKDYFEKQYKKTKNAMYEEEILRLNIALDVLIDKCSTDRSIAEAKEV